MDGENKLADPEEEILSLDLISDRQTKLNQKIQDLSKNSLEGEAEIKQVLSFFQDEIYTNHFRHNYSEFFSVVASIYQADNNFDVQILQQNIMLLKVELDKDLQERTNIFKEARNSILKLFDHITLEIYRFDNNERLLEQVKSAKQGIEYYKSEIESLKKSLHETQNVVSNVEKVNEEHRQHFSKLQGETISVISIFAAVTLAFSGGISYLSSAISAIHNSPILKLLLTILICGFVLFNTIFILLYVVAKMIDKKVFMTCNSQECSDCKENKKKPCSGLKKLKKCFPYLFWIDVILLGMIIGICLFMIFQKSPCCPLWLK